MVKIKGANAADKAQISAARAVNKAEARKATETRAEDTPETKPTQAEKRAAAREQFAKADFKAQAKVTPEQIEEARIIKAARGF